jgi:hypothetical protein
MQEFVLLAATVAKSGTAQNFGEKKGTEVVIFTVTEMTSTSGIDGQPREGGATEGSLLEEWARDFCGTGAFLVLGIRHKGYSFHGWLIGVSRPNVSVVFGPCKNSITTGLCDVDTLTPPKGAGTTQGSIPYWPRASRGTTIAAPIPRREIAVMTAARMPTNFQNDFCRSRARSNSATRSLSRKEPMAMPY